MFVIQVGIKFSAFNGEGTMFQNYRKCFNGKGTTIQNYRKC